MEAGQQQQQQQQYHSWKLNVQAKAKNFNFKLVASNFLPNSKYFPFSLKFKYCRFFIHLKSQTLTSPNPKKPKSLKSKLHRFLQRLRLRRRSNNNRLTSPKLPKNKANISQSSVVLGNLVLFIQSIYQGDKDGIFILGSIVIICFVSLFKKFMERKAWTLLVFVIGALVFFSNAMHLRFRSQFDHQHYLSGFFWRAFKNAASSACLYILSQIQKPVWSSAQSVRILLEVFQQCCLLCLLIYILSDDTSQFRTNRHMSHTFGNQLGQHNNWDPYRSYHQFIDQHYVATDDVNEIIVAMQNLDRYFGSRLSGQLQVDYRALLDLPAHHTQVSHHQEEEEEIFMMKTRSH